MMFIFWNSHQGMSKAVYECIVDVWLYLQYKLEAKK